ncbi:GumC family protein [Methylotenera sp. G11]|uniref:GumC family protein n=1 Tax=Methylotenera sp. G11 TaxID=1506585 RepID=UPI000646E57F|nr:polysaccharide biosynthesis tyrosine autokinase [Methylotenera sp. G11]
MASSDIHPIPSDPESSHRALIEQTVHRMLSTHVLQPAPAAAVEDEDDDTLDLREYWRIIVKRKWTVIGFFIIVLVAVATATLLMTPIYRATSVLQIEREAAKVVEFKDAAQTETAGDRDFYQTQYELLKSRTLAERVVEKMRPALEREYSEDLTLAKESGSAGASGKQSRIDQQQAELLKQEERVKRQLVTVVMNGLTVEPIRNSRLVKLSFDSPSATLAADVTNAVTENFIAVNLERRFDANAYAKNFLEQRIKQVKSKLEETERAQVEFARDKEIFTTDKDGGTTSAQNLQEFNAALSKAQQERIKSESAYRQIQASKSGQLPQGLENELIQQLKENKAKLEAEYQNNLKQFKPGYPKMQELAAQIAEVKMQVATETENARNSVIATYEAAKVQENLLKEMLASSKNEMLDLQTRSIQYNIIKREADTNRQLYDGLLQRLKEVSVAGGVGTNNISVVDHAQVPNKMFKPVLKLNLAIAVILGLVGGIGLALFFEYLDDTFKQASEVERLLGIPVLGLIPESAELNNKTNVVQLMVEDGRSALAEAYRSVRTALQFATAHGAPKLMGVTSTNMGEGKSTSALSIAIQFAQSGQRVLLIDADLRNPSLHRVLGAENTQGLSNCLAGKLQPFEVTLNTTVNNLFAITTGPLPPNPAELLSGKKMQMLLELAAERFDHIIIDSPPILGLADALVIANLVEGMLVVVESGKTRRAAAQASIKRLLSVRAKPLGCLLTKMSGQAHGYGYEYYYGEGYGVKPQSTANQLTT